MKVNGTQLKVGEDKIKLLVGRYAPGRLAIYAVIDDEYQESFAKLTVNLPDSELKEGEFFIKTWSENEHFAEVCLKSGLFRDTGKRVPTGFVEAEIWTLTEGTKLK